MRQGCGTGLCTIGHIRGDTILSERTLQCCLQQPGKAMFTLGSAVLQGRSVHWGTVPPGNTVHTRISETGQTRQDIIESERALQCQTVHTPVNAYRSCRERSETLMV